MGNFANTLFSVLLGWVQSAVSWLWQLVGADGASGLMGWVLDNWLLLTIALCLVGVAVDVVIYLIRWQPYRVWHSFLHRHDAPEEEAPPEPEQIPLQWVYANGETAQEPFQPQEPEAFQEESSQPAPRVIPARNRRADRYGAQAQQGYHQPYYPPQWNAGGDSQDDGGTTA